MEPGLKLKQDDSQSCIITRTHCSSLDLCGCSGKGPEYKQGIESCTISAIIKEQTKFESLRKGGVDLMAT